MGLIDKVNVEVNGSGDLPSTLSTYTTRILKPNIVGGKNILTQAMISSKNTKYVIKWNFDLDSKTITVPKKCVLEFDGGSLKNGTIIGQDTFVNNVGGVETIFGAGITQEGTWRYSSSSSDPKEGISRETANELYQPKGSYQPAGDYPTTPEVEEMIGEIESGKDKDYNPAEFSGLGKVYLKKNIVEVGGAEKNILTQSAFYKEGTQTPNTDTVFVIQYDFDLNDPNDEHPIELPAGAYLEFDGGTISNGKLIGKVRNKEFYPEWFGAKADGVHDDTKAIQQCIDLSDKYGGSVMLTRGVYLISHVDLKTKTHIKGVGIGASIIKSVTEYEYGIINILRNCTQCIISSISVVGNKTQDGIYATRAERISSGEPIPYAMSYYLEENTDIENTMQSYRNLIIDNVYVGHCRYGMNFTNFCYRTIVTRCDVKRCVYGINWPITDSSLHECYIERCDRDGLIVTGSCNNISNIKSIWHGAEAPYESFGMRLRGNRNRYSNLEAQDNYCSGIHTSGNHNMYSNITANHNGYGYEEEVYEEEHDVYTCEWFVNTLNSLYENCEADNYVSPTDDRNNGKLPTYPVYYGAGVLQDQKVNILCVTNALARKPINNGNHIQTSPIFSIDYTKIVQNKGYEITGTDGLYSVLSGYNIPINSEVTFLVEFLIGDKTFENNIVFGFANYFMTMTIRPNGTASGSIGKGTDATSTGNVSLGSVNKQGIFVIGFDTTKPMRASVSSKMSGFDEEGHAIYEATFGIWYFDTVQNGYVYKYSRKTNIQTSKTSSAISDATSFAVAAGSESNRRNDFYLRQVLVTDSPCIIPDITYPGNGLYGLNPILSFDYESANGNLKPFIGDSLHRPSLVYTGARYFDTDLGAPILWNGEKWTLTDGNPVNIRRTGTTAQRPGTELGTDVPKNIGFAYYDTDLGMFVYWDGVSWITNNSIKLTSFGVVDTVDNTLCEKFCVKVAENSTDTEDFEIIAEDSDNTEDNTDTEESEIINE